MIDRTGHYTISLSDVANLKCATYTYFGGGGRNTVCIFIMYHCSHETQCIIVCALDLGLVSIPFYAIPISTSTVAIFCIYLFLVFFYAWF